MDFKTVKEKINSCEIEIVELKRLLKEVCPHDNIKNGGGDTWHDTPYPDYNYYPKWYKCQDCGMYGDEEQEDATNFSILKSKYKNKI